MVVSRSSRPALDEMGAAEPYAIDAVEEAERTRNDRRARGDHPKVLNRLPDV